MNYEKVIFLHIAKTGGTSIVEYFRNRLPANSVLSHGDFFSTREDPPLLPASIADKLFISGHFGYNYIADYLAGAFSFTILRDPLARVLSFYKFFMHGDMQEKFAVAQAARDLSLDDFLVSQLPEVCEVLDNQQTWQLASMYRIVDRLDTNISENAVVLELAKSHLRTLSYIGFTESFDESFTKIVSEVGLDVPAKIPRQLQTADPLLINQIDPAVLKCLRSRLQLDYALYDFAKQDINQGSSHRVQKQCN